MRLSSAIIVCLSLTAFLASVLAAGIDPCSEYSGAKAADGAASQYVVHEHHQQGSDQGEEPGDLACPCCDDCIIACAVSGCSPVSVIAEAAEYDRQTVNIFTRHMAWHHDSPTPHPLFRPPISLS